MIGFVVVSPHGAFNCSSHGTVLSLSHGVRRWCVYSPSQRHFSRWFSGLVVELIMGERIGQRYGGVVLSHGRRKRGAKGLVGSRIPGPL